MLVEEQGTGFLFIARTPSDDELPVRTDPWDVPTFEGLEILSDPVLLNPTPAPSALGAGGHYVVGCTGYFTDESRVASIWTATSGVLPVADVLASRGAPDAFAGWTDTCATDITADGRVIVGHGLNPDGHREAWIARLDEGPADTLAIATARWKPATGKLLVRATSDQQPAPALMARADDGAPQPMTWNATANAYEVELELAAAPASVTVSSAYGGEATTSSVDRLATVYDFDGDGTSDATLFDAATGAWTVTPSTGGADVSVPFGNASTVPAPRDYDGNGITEIGVFQPATGAWFALGSTLITQETTPTEIAVPGDYDGDGKTDAASYDPATGAWIVRSSQSGELVIPAPVFGGPPDFTPVPGDYDGDGITDLAVYSASFAFWAAIPSSGGGPLVTAIGTGSAEPVPGDYDGDGKTDVAVYDDAAGEWRIEQTTAGTAVLALGGSGALACSADFDGDGRTDPAVFDPVAREWTQIRSASGLTETIPTPAAGDPLPAGAIE